MGGQLVMASAPLPTPTPLVYTEGSRSTGLRTQQLPRLSRAGTTWVEWDSRSPARRRVKLAPASVLLLLGSQMGPSPHGSPTHAGTQSRPPGILGSEI
ncbi:unnamed protein product [Rangifer tarandus platyrhynchus]|uniref:Uncharacterized protein n=1 Tax=Rangifer tarandus platyrhynchus TaxID=3082113 RepID=A0ABN8YWL6_RANTA|nr:unnamed protein product [Rangifer tarandus platyrhynchus]